VRVEDRILSYLGNDAGGRPMEARTLRMLVFAKPGIDPTAGWADFDAALAALVRTRVVVMFKASLTTDEAPGSSRAAATEWVQLATTRPALNGVDGDDDDYGKGRDYGGAGGAPLAHEDIAVQAAIAHSILAAAAEGRLAPPDEAMLPWAQGMRRLEQVQNVCSERNRMRCLRVS
jgi:hypothetical protein